MGVFTTTELTATIDEQWDLSVEDGRYENSVIAQRVLDKSKLVANHGDIVNLSYKPTYSVNDVTVATGAVSPQTITIAPVQLTLNKWKEVTIEVVDQAAWMSFYDPKSDFPKDAGMALGEQGDTDLANLYTDLTSNVLNAATAPTVFSKSTFTAAMLKLRDRKIPLNDLSFILPPIAFYNGILQQEELTSADKVGLPKSVLTTGFRIALLGVPMYETTKMPSANNGSSRVGMLVHESTFAIAWRKKNDIRRADGIAAGKLSGIVSVNALYGVKTFREDHGCLFYIKAA